MENHAIKQEIAAADKAINSRDFAALTDFYTEAATLVVRPGLTVSGRNNIRDAHRRISEYFNGTLEVTQGELVIIEAGDTAMVLAKTFIRSPGKPDSEFSSERDAVYVYRKEQDGRWRCAVDNSYGAELLARALSDLIA